MTVKGVEASLGSSLGGRLVAGTLIGIGGLLTTYAVAKYQDELRKLKQTLSLKLASNNILDKSYLGKDLEYVLDFELKIKKLKEELPKDRLPLLSSLIGQYIELVNTQNSHSLSNFRRAIDGLLDLPYKFHEPIEEKVFTDIKKMISYDYPQIDRLINNYIDELTLFINDGIAKPNPLLLLGPAGVGKTRLVNEILSTRLNLPVYSVSFAEFKTENELYGDRNADFCDDFNEGLLFRVLVHASRENDGKGPVIVFFDDICTAFSPETTYPNEKIILEWLTKTLDPALEEIKSELFDRYALSKGVTLKLRNFIFIAAANSDHFLKTKAIQSRLSSRIEFKPMTEEKKIEIARDYSEELEKKKIEAILTSPLEDDQKKLKMQKVVLSEQDKKSIEQIARMDLFPGVRAMLDTIKKWYASKQTGSDFDIGLHSVKMASVQNSSKNFVPGYATYSSTLPMVAPSPDQHDEEHELSQLIFKKLSLTDESKQLKMLKSLFQAGLLNERQYSLLYELCGQNDEKEEKLEKEERPENINRSKKGI